VAMCSRIALPLALMAIGVAGFPGGERALAETTQTLSPAQVKKAVRILRQSRALADLLHGARYRIAHRYRWSAGSQNRLVGVSFRLKLAHPTDMSGKWPTAEYEPTRFPPYKECRKVFTAVGVRGLFVDVDLIRRVVAEVRPAPMPSLRQRFSCRMRVPAARED
jgi:hypothetical protein